MAHYLVRAQPQWAKLPDLRTRLNAREIVHMRPFGRALDDSLRRARRDREQAAVWEEEDYCHPPLAMERAAVLDHYFENIEVSRVEAGQGWIQIEELPSLWDDVEET
jgi:hypothetical protein